MRLLYDFAIFWYGTGLRLAAWFHTKARQWVAGRRDWKARLAGELARKNPTDRPWLWMHCASLGEFEQGRPVLEAIRQSHPGYALLLTFFSPSGYALRKDSPLADVVSYLPLDTAANARYFLQTVQPRLAFFVKYEFWYHFLRELDRQAVPTLLISALFRPRQPFFRWYGGLFRRMLGTFRYIFVQNKDSLRLLKQLDIETGILAGDNRVDRVAHLAAMVPDYQLAKAFCRQARVLVVGSSWPPDEEVLLPLVNDCLPPGWKVIWAPHEVEDKSVRRLLARIRQPVQRYTQLEVGALADARVLLVDTIGMLAGLYQYGRIAYIGGAFATGLHNTLEPAAFGLPVLFGPHYHKFTEAVRLVERGGAFAVQDADELHRQFRKLLEDEAWQIASREVQAFIADNQGATRIVMQYVEELL